MQQRRMVSWAFLALVVAGIALGPVTALEAAVVRGTPVDLDALDTAGATVYQQQRFGIGRIAAMGVGGLGVLGMIFGYMAPGFVAAGAGFGSAFIPGATSSAFDAAPAADGVLAPIVASLQVIQGFVGDRLLHDPLFYLCLAVALGLTDMAKRRQSVLA